MLKHEIAIEAINLSRFYRGNITALDDVSLTVKKGEFFSLLGSSGSGKSSLLRIIAGFDMPSTGDLRIFGKDVVGDAAYKRKTNMVFQQLALFPHLDVFENIAFGMRIRRASRAEIAKKVGEVLALVRLDGYENRQISQLSGGQRQRVAIARALVNDPQVLLLDEPLSALDLKLRQQMQIELRRIQKQLGSTFIFVTHDQGEAITMSDRIAVMDKGRIVQMGKPRDIYENPANTFVAQFMGDSNFLPCTVDGRDGEFLVVHAAGSRMLARKVAHDHSTQGATLAVRFENVEIVDAGNPDGLAAVIDDVIYMGPSQRVALRLDGLDAAFYADVPANSTPGFTIKGQPVRVVWKPGAAVVL